jgi:hypothetical protein
MSAEQLIFLLAFLLVALFNFIRQVRNQRRTQGEGAPPVEPERAPAPPGRVVITPPARPPAGGLERRRPVPEHRAAPPTSVEPARVGRRRLARWPIGHRADVRRGIVLITVLGPCRGLEPPASPTGDLR